MEICKLRFRIQSTGAPLDAKVTFDGQVIHSGAVGSEVIDINHEFDDDIETSHCLEIELSGKEPRHTVVDSTGAIVQDSMLRIWDFELDDIALKHLFYQRCAYHHDTNGQTMLEKHEFWGDMGCNGVVTFDFSSPVYLWLLENM